MRRIRELASARATVGDVIPARTTQRIRVRVPGARVAASSFFLVLGVAMYFLVQPH